MGQRAAGRTARCRCRRHLRDRGLLDVELHEGGRLSCRNQTIVPSTEVSSASGGGTDAEPVRVERRHDSLADDGDRIACRRPIRCTKTGLRPAVRAGGPSPARSHGRRPTSHTVHRRRRPGRPPLPAPGHRQALHRSPAAPGLARRLIQPSLGHLDQRVRRQRAHRDHCAVQHHEVLHLPAEVVGGDRGAVDVRLDRGSAAGSRPSGRLLPMSSSSSSGTLTPRGAAVHRRSHRRRRRRRCRPRPDGLAVAPQALTGTTVSGRPGGTGGPLDAHHSPGRRRGTDQRCRRGGVGYRGAVRRSRSLRGAGPRSRS